MTTAGAATAPPADRAATAPPADDATGAAVPGVAAGDTDPRAASAVRAPAAVDPAPAPAGSASSTPAAGDAADGPAASGTGSAAGAGPGDTPDGPVPPQPAPPGTTQGRIPIVGVAPVVDDGTRPAKAVVDEAFPVSATVFREGHDALAAEAVLVRPDGTELPPAAMTLLAPGTDRFGAWVRPDGEGDWTFLVQAWSDPWATWRHVAEVKVPAGLDVELTFAEGVLLFRRAAAAAASSGDQTARAAFTRIADALADTGSPAPDRFTASTGDEAEAAFAAAPLRDLLTRSEPRPLRVSRQRALVGSWYEFFPRSVGAHRDADGVLRSGTFAQATPALERAAAMGFDVVYLPPVHPIGQAYRKGPNNTLDPGPDDVGSPWAIGSADGGHDAIHPDLGTIEDFDALVARAGELGLEVALDFALQASPDHPWVTSHPEWFSIRADGSIAYAENPPKKYQDIYPVNFDRDLPGITAESVRLLRYWMSHGVRIFRVDNPHTKTVQFWEAVLGEIHRTDPDVVFLAEAFTRPAMMRELAKVGFDQSYTYFTWRTGKEEITEYLTELSEVTAPVLRPNFFVNTPDILHGYLRRGGPAAFAIRAVLAATSSPTWGVYSGFELFEGTAVREGSEEYLDTEKFQLRPRDFAGAEERGETLVPLITALNRIRHEHPALQRLRGLRFHTSPDDDVLVYSRAEGDDVVLTVLLLDPFAAHETVVEIDETALGFPSRAEFDVTDLLSGETWRWGRRNYVRLDPWTRVAHILSVTPVAGGVTATPFATGTTGGAR